MRRYCISAALGIVTDKDTDAGGQQVKASSKPQLKQNTSTWEKAQEYIAGGGDIEKITSKYDVSSTLISKLKSI